MNLIDATIDELIDYLLVNPDPAPSETGEILLNLLHRVKQLEAQNKRQDVTLQGTTQSLSQLLRSRNKARAYAARRRFNSRQGPATAATQE